MVRHRIAQKRCYACWCCRPAAHDEGSTVGEHIRHDGMAPHRSEEMLCLLALLTRRLIKNNWAAVGAALP